MKISTKGRYSIRFITDLAIYSVDDPVKIKDVAGRQKISEKYLEQIASLLCKAELIRSVRGPRGGYVMNINLDECTLGMILRVTEKNHELVPCVRPGSDDCEMSDECIVRNIWIKLEQDITDLFDSVTIQDILDKSDDFKCEL